MTAYVISEVEIRDPSAVAAYKPLAKAAALAFGGEYLARDTVPEALEGAFEPGQRLVIIRFSDAETARRWYTSPQYADALRVAAGGLDRRLFIVEGI